MVKLVKIIDITQMSRAFDSIINTSTVRLNYLFYMRYSKHGFFSNGSIYNFTGSKVYRALSTDIKPSIY